MLEEDRFVFDTSIEEYTRDLIKFIMERMSPHEYTHSITVHKGTKNGRATLELVSVHIDEKRFNNQSTDSYCVNIKEKVKSLGDKKIFTKKFSYEVINKEITDDFIRFDYCRYPEFPHLHINACEDIWGNHLTFPESTNLNLEKIDCMKALNIFQKYVSNPSNHILDAETNQQYLYILDGGKENDKWEKQ